MTTEQTIIARLDERLQQGCVRRQLDAVAARMEQQLVRVSDAAMAWEPVPLGLYGKDLPRSVRSSWVFVLRAGTTTGAERHPNSRQRMMSYRGTGDLQRRLTLNESWTSHRLTSDDAAPLESRWLSIPENVWHQAVVGPGQWVVVSFHSVAAEELIEERPVGNGELARRTYIPSDPSVD